jgi:hypothetical protein
VVDLPHRGEALLRENLTPGEQVLVRLRGAWGQALVLTTKRLYIVKWGLNAGNLFGGRCLAFDFRSIVAVNVRKSLLTGVVEIVSAGTQNLGRVTGAPPGRMSAIQSDSAISFWWGEFGSFQQAANLTREMVSRLAST